MGLVPNDDLLEQLCVLIEALSVYAQRQDAYGEIWKQYGARSNVLQCARKSDRLMELWWHNPDGATTLAKDALDDALDLINYAVFTIRNARMGNIDGQAPERPSEIR